ncbi:MAG: tetratricopeptide repeat protein [Capsulimonadales bacterium]|nr:tetratricopeptide repeat protein [Capsulimonadales bacterium]
MVSEQVIWKVELLGQFRLQRDEQIWERFQTRKTEALFTYLALHPERRHPREVLCDLLWPETDRDSSRNRLSQAVGWLRPRLESEESLRGRVLLTDRQRVGIEITAIATDVSEFLEAVASAERTTDPTRRLERYKRAVGLYSGHLTPALEEEWVLSERQRLYEIFRRSLNRLLTLLEERQAMEEALTLARWAVSLDPLSEDVHGNVIRLLLKSGQFSAAQRHYQGLSELLTKHLDQKPYQDWTEFLKRNASPQPKATEQETTREVSVPVPLTRFFGRQEELARIEQMILQRETRLITLTGLGGTGKTRLAVELAHRLSGEYRGAVWFIPLADVSDANLIPAAIADGIKGEGARTAGAVRQIVTTLQDQPALLILDNLEHLAEGAVDPIRHLLERLPLLTIVVTSRQLLGVTGERELTVPPLMVPDTENAPRDALGFGAFPGVQLFLDRARAVRPNLSLTAENAPILSRLCSRLDGLPLAIELCAAWAQTLTPEEMLDHLNRRFDLLVSRRRDIPARHRTLRATLEYSYLLLPENLQRLFLELSVFRGGWTLDAALAVCGLKTDTPLALLKDITELRERSLVVASESKQAKDRAMRFRMLESVREFAAEQQTIADRARLMRRHFDFFRELTVGDGSGPDGSDPANTHRKLTEEQENLRAALAWAEEVGWQQEGLDLAVALTDFWEMQGDAVEGIHWIQRFFGSGKPPRDAYREARALLAMGQLRRATADYGNAKKALEEALLLFRKQQDHAGTAHALMILGTIANTLEENPQARTLLNEALHFARCHGDPSLVARVVSNLATVAMDECDWPIAWNLFEQILTYRRSEGNEKRLSSTLNNLGLVARYQGEYDRALSLLKEGLQLALRIADRPGIGISYLNLATVYRLVRQLEPAKQCLLESLRLTYTVDDRRAFAWCVKEAGHIACADGDFATGVSFLGTAEKLRGDLGISFKPADPMERERDLERARNAIGPDPVERYRNEGMRMNAAEVYHAARQKFCPVPEI